ncbi:hypothetical protein N7508_007527 [Penicillium antarcticum]|uniref:uncharacterized protein n=1 Tax=Penicillium antarcticum TaxID=416450 RepID=UPI0023A0F5B8|nr:uncharacterized protein N7508_007527 [Penicillium antarcticum]KAJ5300284.1 hypothetical protein N7508_007527 [Penicillium antarcticum]
MHGGTSKLVVAVDIGTTSTVVCWKWSDSNDSYVLKFPSDGNAKTNEELEAVLGCSQQNWYYGDDARYRSEVVVFEHPKLAAMGQQPYTKLLEEALRGATEQRGLAVTLGDLYEKIFSYIWDTLKGQFLKTPERDRYCGDRNFDEIPKHCRVTYPVQYNAWLRMILADAAKNVGFHEVDGVPEPVAAGYFVRSEATPVLSGLKTILILDCGGGSTDAATLSFDDEGRIKLVCPTDGFNGGSQMINDAVRDALQARFPDNNYLRDDSRWAKLSREIDGQKRRFEAEKPVEIDLLLERVSIDIAEMKTFFHPLVQNTLALLQKQATSASEKGFPPTIFVMTGGLSRNIWVRETIFSEARRLIPGIECSCEIAAETVARGALYYAQNPVKEETVARVDLGLTYLEDRSPRGRPLGGDRVEEAIAWVIVRGRAAGPESRVELIKIVYRESLEPANNIISSKVFTTSDHFDQDRIEANTRNELDCPITYPIPSNQSHLDYKGIIEGRIPHNELFPHGSSHKKVEARFIMSVKPKGQLLEAVVYLKRDSNPPLEIGTKLVSAASWVPRSEFDVETERYDGHRMLPISSQEPGTGGVKRTRKKKISLGRKNYYDSPVPRQGKSNFSAATGPGRESIHPSPTEEMPLPRPSAVLFRRHLPSRGRKRSLSL